MLALHLRKLMFIYDFETVLRLCYVAAIPLGLLRTLLILVSKCVRCLEVLILYTLQNINLIYMLTPVEFEFAILKSNVIKINCFRFRTIRIYPVNSQRSREIYHTRRMQKIFSVKWSADSR